ncbi:hypothetical protein FO519_005208 [Halicephalobus sp. NKZ332]|nr:hypothetical protein FO519_005208 [Halicephalobus sp. NKZ332]
MSVQKKLLFVFVGLCLIEVGLACLSSGVCGGSPCGGAPPPPPPACGGGCQSGYQCGQFGCYRARARAHSSNTVNVEDAESQFLGSRRPGVLPRPGSSLSASQQPIAQSPNEAFMSCCESRGLPDACLAKCTFNTYNKEALMGMYFRTDACPIQAAAEIQYCAAQGRDHTDCCARNGVTTTLAGEKCLTFCDQRPGNVTQLDFSYVSCYDRFEQMKACFWHGANGAY